MKYLIRHLQNNANTAMNTETSERFCNLRDLCLFLQPFTKEQRAKLS